MTDQRTLTVPRKLIVDTVNTDPYLPWGHLDEEVAERVAAAVLAQFDGVESAEVTTEYAVRWARGNDDGTDAVERHYCRSTAERAARLNHGEAVHQTVRTWRSPLTAVTP